MAQAALVLDESFNYADGNLDGQGGWTVSGGTAPASVEAGNLDVAGLPISAGKRIQMDGSAGVLTREDGADALNTTGSGNAVYFSYILHITDAASYTTTYETVSEVSIAGNFLCLIQMKDNGGGKVKFATRRAIGGTPTSGSSNPTPFATNDAIFIVGKWEVNTGGNDIAKLWVDPDQSTFGAASEPATDATSTSGGSDPSNGAVFGGFRFTAGMGAEVDSLRIGRTWADVTTAGVAPVGAKLAFTTQPTAAAPGGTMAPVIVRVLSSGGANVASNGVPVTLTLTAGSGTLSGTLSQVTDANGQATFGDLSIDEVGAGKQLTATASGIGAGLAAAVSTAFTIAEPAAASRLSFITQPAEAAAGASLGSVVVQVQNASGGAVATNGIPITVALTSGSGTLTGTLAHNTDGTGKATFSDLSVDTAGTGKRLTVSAPGLTSTISGIFVISASSPVLQEWTHESVFGESSAAVAMDVNYMFVADNEDELLRLYLRQPGNRCAAPVYTFDARPFLNLSSSNPEMDLEAAVKATDINGTRIYWLGSHSHSTGGSVRTNRYRLFATQVTGTGTGSPAYSLAYLGRYDHLRTDLVTWDKTNGHGLGSNYFGLSASTNVNVSPELTNGFNIEGLTIAPDGTNAWIGFRAPLVSGSGPTTNGAPRTHALIVTLKNLPALVTGSPTAGPGAAQFGPAIRLNLGQRGIRSIDATGDGQYLITSGPPGDASSPPVAPLNYRLFSWTGNTNDAPIERSTTFASGYNPEGAMLPAGPVTSSSVIHFVSDDTSSCWRSFTAHAGATILPGPFSLTVAPPTGGPAQLNLTAPTGFTYTVEFSAMLTNWSWLRTVNSTGAITPFTDPGATNETRFYRARY